MIKRGSTDHHTPNQDCSNCGQLGHPWFACPHTSSAMDATNVVTFTDIVGIGYHLQGQLVHPKAVITTEDNHHAPDTPEIDTMTEEAVAGLMLGLIQETEVQATQDTPAQTDTPADEGTHETTTELKADHPTGSDLVAIDH